MTDFFSWQVGLLDLEVNTLTKLLFFAVIVLSVVMLALKVSDLMTSV